MKKILLVLVAALFGVYSFGQAQIENSGFEGLWEDVPGTPDEPEQWSSLKTADQLGGLAPEVAFPETTDPHTGTYCIRLKVVTTLATANGLLTNGKVHAELNPNNGYVYTWQDDADYNYAFTDRPDSLVFWVKHAPVGGDKSKFEIILHDETHVTNNIDNNQTCELPHDGTTSHWVGKARADITGTMGSWTRLAAPFNYFNNNLPTHLLATIAAGDSTIAVTDTEMWIDDIELIYNPNLVIVTPAATQNIDVGVNGNLLTVAETPNSAVTGAITREWKFGTTSGGPYAAFGSPETGMTYMPNFAATGIYYVICETDFGTEVVESNEVEIVVTDPLANTVTITPSATQTILTSTNGNMLTATETPAAASSREWKFSTTSGSGYISFVGPETTTTYTPNFANLGTYYIICESDFAGDVQISNEVTIMVPSSAGIDEDGIKFNIYANGDIINLVFSSQEPNAVFEVFTLAGKKVYSSNLNTISSEHSINGAQGIYVYRVVSGDKIVTGKIKL